MWLKLGIPTVSAVVAIASISISFFYIDSKNAEIRGLDTTIKNQKELIREKSKKISDLTFTVSELRSTINFQARKLETNVEEINEYQDRIKNIRVREVPVFRDIIVKPDIAIEEANDFTNETLKQINASAAEFNRVHDKQN
jgi:seryl-tRNA synthetase